MDPLSIGVSVVGILAGTRQVYGLLKTSVEPSKRTRDLQAELLELENVLQLIQTSLSDESDLLPFQIDAVSKALVKIADLQSHLQLILTKAGENVGGEHWHWFRNMGHFAILGATRNVRSITRELTLLVIPQSSRLESTPFEIKPRLNPPFILGGSTDRTGFLENEPGLAPELGQHSTYHRSRLGSVDDILHLHRPTTRRVLGVIRSIRPCSVLIFLAFATIAGSLVPALWRSISHNDIQGGFSLAQYILGVGVFVIGCVVAIHSRTCTCWSSSSRANSLNQASPLELEAVDNVGNVQIHELPD